MTNSKVLLFDLGNVLLPIDLDLTFKGFAKYSSKYSFEEIKKITHELGLWEAYESGNQSEDEFRSFLKKELHLICTKEQFDEAFNALLLDIPVESYLTLQQFKPNFKSLNLLSNTSSIHSNIYFKNNIGPNGENLFDLFDQIFLSYELGLVKPDALIYQKVAENLQVDYKDIIFFDDNAANIETALNLGIQAILINPNTSLLQITNTLSNYVDE
ncbi:HAD family phosphatase [Sandaracinomonas limnophila]|uniref:HAD family phosphatase n=1 Tax=Sandaracinomonas limnophila TaxID=1862386 RepID=A0A437PX10_9BACT|nr:HAD-IA family hydrolase [Sandaracinomonas limnophila]RVU26769.1 HAD family phosphatase [Sandaracinomonas limnophila]